jgi:hypothetical protein
MSISTQGVPTREIDIGLRATVFSVGSGSTAQRGTMPPWE